MEAICTLQMEISAFDLFEAVGMATYAICPKRSTMVLSSNAFIFSILWIYFLSISGSAPVFYLKHGKQALSFH